MHLGSADVIATIADAEIESTVGPHDQTMHIVATKGDMNTIPGVQTFAHILLAIAICVTQFPKIRNARIVNIVTDCEHSGSRPLQEPVESLSKNERFIHFQVAIRIDEQPDPIVVLGKLLE